MKIIDSLTSKLSEKNILWLIVFLGVILIFGQLTFNFLPDPDSSWLYLPMAEAMVRGDWNHAFQPTCPPVFSIIVALFTIVFKVENIFLGARIVSSVMTFASFLMCGLICRHFWGKRIGYIGLLVFLALPQNLIFGTTAMLYASKVFFTMLFGYAFVLRKRSQLLFILLAGMALALLALSRAEALASSLSLAGLSLSLALVKMRGQRLAVIKDSLLIGLLACLMIAPWVAYQYRSSGWLVTDPRQIGYLVKIMGAEKKQISPSEQIPKTFFTQREAYGAVAFDDPKYHTFAYRWGQFLDAFYTPFFIISLIFIGLKIRRRQWSLIDSLLLVSLLFNILIFWMAGIVIRRYLGYAALFQIPWVAQGLYTFYNEMIANKLWLKRVSFLVILVIVSRGISEGMKSVKWARKSRHLVLANGHRTCAESLQSLPEIGARSNLPSGVRRRVYLNGRPKRVLSTNSVVCQLAGTEFISLHALCLDLQARAVEICYNFDIEYLVIDDAFRKFYPRLNLPSVSPAFSLVYQDQLGERGFEIIRFDKGLVNEYE